MQDRTNEFLETVGGLKRRQVRRIQLPRGLDERLRLNDVSLRRLGLEDRG